MHCFATELWQTCLLSVEKVEYIYRFIFWTKILGKSRWLDCSNKVQHCAVWFCLLCLIWHRGSWITKIHALPLLGQAHSQLFVTCIHGFWTTLRNCAMWRALTHFLYPACKFVWCKVFSNYHTSLLFILE